MTPRERPNATLNHQTIDHLRVDFGAGGQTGIGICVVHKLRQALSAGAVLRRPARPYHFNARCTSSYKIIL